MWSPARLVIAGDWRAATQDRFSPHVLTAYRPAQNNIYTFGVSVEGPVHRPLNPDAENSAAHSE